MPQPTVAIRSATKRQLHQLLLASDTITCEVAYGAPNPEESLDHIFVGEATGTQDTATQRQDRRTRNDRYTVTLYVLAHAATAEAADEAAELIGSGVEDIIAENPTLAIDGQPLAGLAFGAVITEVVGPTNEPTDDEGWISAMTINVECGAQLR